MIKNRYQFNAILFASCGMCRAFLWSALIILALVNTATLDGKTVTYEKDVLPLIGKYCFDCHGDGAKKGDVALDGFTNSAAVMSDPKLWERILQNVRNYSMPPAKKKTQPTSKERELMVRWVEQQVFPVDCEHPDPGRVTIRRLNRVEYNNTVRDLLGVQFQPAQDFPQDDVGYGFDNIGDVLSLPPVLLEKYMAAAEDLVNEAIVTEDLRTPHIVRLDAQELTGRGLAENRGNGWLAMMKEGDIVGVVRVRIAGEYILRVRLAGDQAGDEPVKAALRIGDEELTRWDIPERRKDAKVREFKTRIAVGTQHIAVRYMNNFVDPTAKDPNRRDRNLLMQYLEVDGPYHPEGLDKPESHTRLFKSGEGIADASKAGERIIGHFAKRAWRRPLDRNELDRLMKLFELARSQGESLERSVQIVVKAVLVSPHFLFRGEFQPEPDNPQQVHPIGEHALASRLSYFLWSSMPDEELFALADAGKLRRNLDKQIRRMLTDEKSRALVDHFGGQWLQTRNLDIVNPDRGMFPMFTAELRGDMARETQLFFEEIVRKDRSLLEFLDADYSFLNERLAMLYGIEGVRGNEFRRVAFRNRQRGGLLSQASILTITSNPTRTSPVQRGKWVLDNLLGTPPPPPPPNVPELKDGKGHTLQGTLRQRMEQHRANPTCASCHDRMDPIGFGFENYDAIGRWRTEDGGAEIEPGGRLVTGESFSGADDLRRILMVERRSDFLRCLTEKMLVYALGRGLEYYDRCAVETITSNLAGQKYRFSALVSEVVKSAPFQLRRGEGKRIR